MDEDFAAFSIVSLDLPAVAVDRTGAAVGEVTAAVLLVGRGSAATVAFCLAVSVSDVSATGTGGFFPVLGI